jgi:hypothetical protein
MAYKAQASFYNRDISRLALPPIDFGDAGRAIVQRRGSGTAEEVLGLGADFAVRLAVRSTFRLPCPEDAILPSQTSTTIERHDDSSTFFWLM